MGSGISSEKENSLFALFRNNKILITNYDEKIGEI